MEYGGTMNKKASYKEMMIGRHETIFIPYPSLD